MSNLYYKLTSDELAELGAKKLISTEEAREIILSSTRKPAYEFNENVVRVYLNKSKTIWVQSIHFYGGEHFREPHFFVAEIMHTTTGSAFSRFLNSRNLRWVRQRSPFTY